MKKLVILSALLVLLAACGSKQEPSENSSAEVSPSTSETKSNSSSNPATGSSKTNSIKSSSEESSTAESQTSSSEEADAFSELTEAYPKVKMPQKLPRDESLFLNIAAVGDKKELSVLYYNMTEALVMNHNALNQQTPFASFKKTTYDTTAKAKEAVNYQYDDGGQKVDLGHNIEGYQQSGAGSTYLNWQEGNWSLVVRASNVLGQEPVTTAKEVVNYLEEAFLPVPKSVGQITIDLSAAGYQATTVIWQEEKVVYAVSHEDPLPALEMAVSVE